MRFLVLSDVHGTLENVRRILRRACDEGMERLSYVIFLGDGLRDMDALSYDGEFSWLPMLFVRGNCDFFGASDTPELRELIFCGHKLLLTHGHRYEVKSGLSRLVSFALAKGADLVLFGHTHSACEIRLESGEDFFGVKLSRPLILFNPGSTGYGGEYGEIFVDDKEILCYRKKL